MNQPCPHCGAYFPTGEQCREQFGSGRRNGSLVEGSSPAELTAISGTRTIATVNLEDSEKYGLDVRA